jgi:hypothetical protein
MSDTGTEARGVLPAYTDELVGLTPGPPGGPPTVGPDALLATVDDVAALAGPELSIDPERCERLLAMASKAVRTYTAQTLTLVEDDEVIVISDGTEELVLSQRPVVDVTHIEIEEREVPGRVSWDSFGHLRRRDGLPWGRRYDHVGVVYTHGYAPVPDDIVGLVAAKVAGFLAASEANPGGLRALQVGGRARSGVAHRGREGGAARLPARLDRRLDRSTTMTRRF